MMTVLSLIAVGVIIAMRKKPVNPKQNVPSVCSLMNSLLLEWSDICSGEEEDRTESCFLVIHGLIFHKSRKWYTYLYFEMMVGCDVSHFYLGNAVKLSLSKIILGFVKKCYTINYITYELGWNSFLSIFAFQSTSRIMLAWLRLSTYFGSISFPSSTPSGIA